MGPIRTERMYPRRCSACFKPLLASFGAFWRQNPVETGFAYALNRQTYGRPLKIDPMDGTHSCVQKTVFSVSTGGPLRASGWRKDAFWGGGCYKFLPGVQATLSLSLFGDTSPQHLHAPGTANSALEHLLRSELMERIPAHKAATKVNVQGPGLAGAVRTQKNVI
eukprot:gene12328-biopygen18472